MGSGRPRPAFGAQWGYYPANETQNTEEGISALVLCGHRYYDPHTGRWLTRDPAGYAGGINQYAYCGNNPVNVSAFSRARTSAY